MPARPKNKNQLTKSPKTDSKNISMITTSKIVWVPIATKLTENTWKLKWKMSKQVKVVLDKSPLTELKTAVVRLKKCPISEMKTAVVKLKRLVMPKLKVKSLNSPGTESKQIKVVLEKPPLTELKTVAVRPKTSTQLTNTPKTDSKNISTISSKFVWDADKKSWKLKWKMSKQVKVVLEKSPLTELKTAVVQLEKCPILEMKTAVVKLKRLAVPNLIKKLLEKNPGNDYSRKPLLSESERNAIKLMIIENQKASNASKKKLFIKKTKKLPDYEQRRLTNIRERKTMFANLKNNSLILSASKSERRKIFSIPKRIPKD